MVVLVRDVAFHPHETHRDVLREVLLPTVVALE